MSLGINIFKKISPVSYESISEFIKSETNNIRTAYSLALPPGFQNSRKLYRSFRIDPTRYRPSSEALWRRVKKGESLPEINPFVDITNFLSLMFQIPYGLYDIEKLNGDVKLIKGGENMWYEGIRKERVSLHGKIVLSDGSGPFGNPSSDSLRVSTDASSVNILQVIFFIPGEENKGLVLKSSADLYRHHFNTSEISSYII